MELESRAVRREDELHSVPGKHVRGERLQRASQTGTVRGNRGSDTPPSSPRAIGVLRSIVGDVLKWQRIRYKDRPPVVDKYEAYGAIEDGYPLETATADIYDQWVFGDGAVDITVLPIEAVYRGGYWIIHQVFKGESSPLDPEGEIAGCNFG